MLPRLVCRTIAITCIVFWASGCSSAAPSAPATVPDNATTADTTSLDKTGFLRPEERPDALVIIPSPPAPGSNRMAADIELHRESLRWRDTPRWQLAASDANVKFPEAAEIFACAAGIRISQASTPNLYSLLQRSIIDAGKSTAPAKEKYDRPRPFVVYDEPTCVKSDEAMLRGNGSFPSGTCIARLGVGADPRRVGPAACRCNTSRAAMSSARVA